MRRLIPIKEDFEYSVPYSSEKRVVVTSVGSDLVSAVIDFDSTQLDLGQSNLYDLTEMLKAGVQPGSAVPHVSNVVDNLEMASSIVDEFVQLNNQE